MRSWGRVNPGAAALSRGPQLSRTGPGAGESDYSPWPVALHPAAECGLGASPEAFWGAGMLRSDPPPGHTLKPTTWSHRLSVRLACPQSVHALVWAAPRPLQCGAGSTGWTSLGPSLHTGQHPSCPPTLLGHVASWPGRCRGDEDGTPAVHLAWGVSARAGTLALPPSRLRHPSPHYVLRG